MLIFGALLLLAGLGLRPVTRVWAQPRRHAEFLSGVRARADTGNVCVYVTIHYNNEFLCLNDFPKQTVCSYILYAEHTAQPGGQAENLLGVGCRAGLMRVTFAFML